MQFLFWKVAGKTHIIIDDLKACNVLNVHIEGLLSHVAELPFSLVDKRTSDTFLEFFVYSVLILNLIMCS